MSYDGKTPQSRPVVHAVASGQAEWVDLCAEQQVPQVGAGGLYVACSNRGLAVFRLGAGQVQVIDDACPHAGGSLSAGHIEELDGQACVVCPWHGWPFDLQTGCCPDSPAYAVRVYPSRIVNGRVLAKLDAGA